MHREPTGGLNTELMIIVRTLMLAFVLFFPAVLAARESTDVIVMNNGDRLTCTIKRLEAGVLYVGLDYVDGDVSIDWKKVARIESKQLFIVKTQDGSVFVGDLTTIPKTNISQAVQLEIADPEAGGDSVTIDKSQVVGVQQTANEFWKRLNGGINFGATYSKGNTATQYSLGFDTAYQRERWGAQTDLTSNLASSSGATTSTRNMLALSAYQLLPWENYFYGGLTDFLQSSVQGIRLQTSLGGGIGRFLKNTNRSRISLMGGLAYQTTNYHETGFSQPAQNVVSGLIAVDLSLFKFSKTNLKITASIFPALSQPGRVRFGTNATYFVKLFGDLSWTITFYGNWDTEPPAHFSGSDYGTTSGLSWTFGK